MSKLGDTRKPTPGIGTILDPIHNLKTMALDFARPNKYIVQLFPNRLKIPFRSVLGIPFDEALSLACSNAVLPGKNYTTFDDRRGLPNSAKKAGDLVYNDVQLTFQVSSLMIEHNVIQEWMNFIYDENGEFYNFHKDYKTDIHIIQLNQTRHPVKYVKLIDAFPTQMGDIALGYDMNDQIETFNVTFAYHHWESIDLTNAQATVPDLVEQMVSKIPQLF